MTPLARTALRLSLAGAGIAALGAGVVGQASAAELPEAPDAPDTSALPSYEDGTLSNDANSVSFGELQTPHGETSGLPELPSADAFPGLPSTDALPSADLVIGSRWVRGGSVVNWPARRQALSRCGNLYVRLLLGIDVHDATAGYRLFHRRTLEKIDLATVQSTGYVFQTDLAARTQQQSIP